MNVKLANNIRRPIQVGKYAEWVKINQRISQLLIGKEKTRMDCKANQSKRKESKAKEEKGKKRKKKKKDDKTEIVVNLVKDHRKYYNLTYKGSLVNLSLPQRKYFLSPRDSP